ncbi:MULTISPECIES: hypothetical protein [Rhodanobacteraceae]|uniref:hypothetical protein n=1 Tax=Rhodanobacteraceae TaxID=1775411 RepID=UPI000881116E|nr:MULTISPECIES: hypothetical protein [Rhodanobacteraceae]SDF41222.1 hypothetical protein SAMN04515659_0891 [Dyella sp. 333MFSha]SKB27538.1 hypothetical protein SAMN05660880_00258 [Luteibacter sp. 22Crub2.1]
MNKISEDIINAHGGLHTWLKFRQVSATLDQGGALWGLKGKGGILDHTTVTVATDIQWASHAPFGSIAARSDFATHRIALLDGNDEVITALDNPRESFAGHALDTPWDDLQLAFFAGCAMWTYLNTPFVLAWDGVECEDAGPWEENGETWRKVNVRYPDSLEVFSKAQALYIGPDGLVRRLDYDVEIAGNTPGAHYVSDYTTVEGIKFPTKRAIYPRQPDGQRMAEPLVVSIELSHITLG